MQSNLPTVASAKTVFPFVALGVLTALFFWRIITPNASDRAMFPPGDFSDQFYAFRLYETRELALGRLPLWSDDFNAGHPFLADIQAAVFYPPALANSLLNAWLGSGVFSFFALELEAILHFVLAGAFTYLFARRVLQDGLSAFISAIVFEFGGYLTSYPSLQLAILETATWLPLAFYFLHQATEAEQGDAKKGGRWENYIYAGVVLGIAALAGHPQTFLFVVYACAAYIVYRFIRTRPGSSPVKSASRLLFSLLPFALVLLIAFSLAAVQLVPSLEYMQLSTRQSISFTEAARGLATLDILQFILPGFVSAFASPLYAGVLPLWLAAVALLHGKSEARFFLVLGAGSLLLAFGYYAFAYAVFYNFAPGFGIFRQQERIALIFSFSLAMLAGFGMRSLVRMLAPVWAASRITSLAIHRLWALLPMGAVVSGVMLLAFYLAGLQKENGRLAFLADRAGLMVLLFVLATLIAGAYLKRSISARSFALVAIAFSVFDLFSINEPANKAAPYDRYPATNLFASLAPAESIDGRVVNEANLPGHYGIAYRVQDTGGISPLRIQRYDLLKKLPRDKLWALLNVKWVAAKDSKFDNLEPVARDGDIRLLAIRDPGPRAWMPAKVRVEADDDRVLMLMAQSDWDPRVEAILSSPPSIPLPDTIHASSVKMTRRDAGHLTLDVTSAGDGILVISENFYPGWNARVDGIEAPVLRANVTLRAVEVRSGTHHIELSYDPLSFKLGVGITVLTLISLAGIFVYIRRP